MTSTRIAVLNIIKNRRSQEPLTTSEIYKLFDKKHNLVGFKTISYAEVRGRIYDLVKSGDVVEFGVKLSPVTNRISKSFKAKPKKAAGVAAATGNSYAASTKMPLSKSKYP
jgi:hypothetical protein